MEIISKADYRELLGNNNRVLERDGFGIKVVETSDEKIIKVFRLKRYYSSALFKPYALRFKDNADQLKALEIPSVTVERIAYCPQVKRYITVYPKLAGRSLRLKITSSYDPSLLIQLAQFMSTLHAKGVYFRSLHLANVLTLDNGQLGLIDIADARILKSSLKPRLRARNFRHLLRHESDSALIKKFGVERFVSAYQRAADMSPAWIAKFEREWVLLKLSF